MSIAEFLGMKLDTLLFEPTLVRSPLRIVAWWERRRAAYNLAVGATGVATLAYGNAVSLLVLHHPLTIPWQAVVVYGIAANVMYSMGCVVETAVERWLGRPVYGFGPALFRYGLVFALGLTFLPNVFFTVMGLGGLLFP